jgi:alpha-tubulin suppressor-like RCC1 family protein
MTFSAVLANTGNHSLFIQDGGLLKGRAVGRNNNGQVGDGTTTERSYPVRAKNSDGIYFTAVKDVNAAGCQTMYLKHNGEVWGAGKVMLFANLFSSTIFAIGSAFQFLGNLSCS